MADSKFVILGGGMVAGYAAKQMVEMGLKAGDLAILSADNTIPYERPPLSKGLLAGKDTEESILINPPAFYEKSGVEIKLGCEIVALDLKRKRLLQKSGTEFGFNKLIVATGARPRLLDVPGAKLKNLFYLRSIDDSKAIRSATDGAKQAVVLGGGFIGMEVAAVLAQKGIEVTIVFPQDRISKRLFTPEMSSFFESYYTSRGVRIVKGMSVAELRGDGVVSSAILGDGQAIACGMVVAGVGVQPAIETLAGSGLELGDGVMVDAYLESNQPGILAAGDVANYQDVIFGKRRRVEHWDNAVSQGQHCGRTLMGERAAFKHVPYFFSDVFDLSYEYWGDSAGAEEVIHRGDFAENSFSVWWLKQGRAVAAFTMNRPDEEREAAPKWIEAREYLSAAKLRDPSQAIGAAAEG